MKIAVRMGVIISKFLLAWGLILGSMSTQASSCYDSPKQAVSSNTQVYACPGEEPKFCANKASSCKKIDLEQWDKKIKSSVGKSSNYAARKTLKRLRKSDTKTKAPLTSYLALMQWKKPIRAKNQLQIQTGPYGRLHLSDNTFSTRCLTEIMESAYLLEKHFPNITFNIDGRIKNCSRLISGIRKLISNKVQVEKTIARFYSPMHTVFLTTQTKFNHYLLGKMGLYIDVNRKNEIKKRLIQARISESDIRHETRPM